jgi:hypothetical protein
MTTRARTITTICRYLENVHPEQLIPELVPLHAGMVGSPEKKLCLDTMGRK